MKSRFAAPLEGEFQRDYARKALPVVRAVLLLGSLFLAASAALDDGELSATGTSALGVRFVPAIGILLGTFLWSFHRSSRKRISWILALVFVSAAALLLFASVANAVPVFVGTALLFGSALLLALVLPYLLEAFARREFARRSALQKEKEAIEGKTRSLDEALVALEKAEGDLVRSERMAALGSLVAGLVHELASPLAVIRAGADISGSALSRLEQSREPLPGRVIEALAAAHGASLSATERLSAILKSLRNFSRLDSAGVEGVDVNEGLEDAIALLDPKLHKGITLRRKHGDIPRIAGQASELNLVFMHVLRNASQAIESAGTITLETSCEGDVVSVRVTDDGRGIDPEVMKLLFVPPFRRTEMRAGAGIGLFLCHQIVEKHGGRILVASETGRGTSITIKLPRDRSAGVA